MLSGPLFMLVTAILRVTWSLFWRGCRLSEVCASSSDPNLSAGHLATVPALVQIHANLLNLCDGSDPGVWRLARLLHDRAPAPALPSISSGRLRSGEVIQKE